MEIYLLQIAIFLMHIFHSPLLVSCFLNTPYDNLDPSSLPSDFLFGTASSAYQFEGAYLADGKGLSNWDVYTHQPGNIVDGSNGDVAVDHYHRYPEDIGLMQSLGVNSYRFSISWARVLPKRETMTHNVNALFETEGRYGDVNIAGIDYYNRLIDTLLEKGIQPFVTLTHYDFPQELENRYGGWLSPESQKDFGYFTDICFRYFGYRVKYWATFNEPNLQSILGYRSGQFPPSRCSPQFGNCTAGDSEKEPFIVAHNIILSHANAVDIYRHKYQKKQGGTIGIVLHAAWFEPISNSSADKLAAERALSFFMNWFLDPIILGRYPKEMTEILGPVLTQFSAQEQEKLKNKLDFIGINHYTSYYVQDCISKACQPGHGTSKTEGYYKQTSQKNGVPIGEPTGLEWLNFYPQGMENMINYIKERYNNTPMFVTENGYGERGSPSLEGTKSIQDVKRVEYMAGHLNTLITAVRKGADVRGYFAWSLLDNFEWDFGYTVRFGLHHVDYATLQRTPKLSAIWFKQIIEKHKKTKMKLPTQIETTANMKQPIRSLALSLE